MEELEDVFTVGEESETILTTQTESLLSTSPSSFVKSQNSYVTDDNKKNMKITHFRVINTNARSIGPKKQALVDCFDEHNLDIGIITETWLQANTELEQGTWQANTIWE